jgi:catechol 2,3-dioxygenase-like lactoylglutathione lyase family enzyme
MEIHGIEHIGIVTKSMEESSAFYSKLLGFEAGEVHDFPDKQMKIGYLSKDNGVIELLEPYKKEGGSFGIKHVAIRCSGIEEVLKTVKEKGYKLLHQEPQVHGDRKFFFCQGPDGEYIEFME